MTVPAHAVVIARSHSEPEKFQVERVAKSLRELPSKLINPLPRLEDDG